MELSLPSQRIKMFIIHVAVLTCFFHISNFSLDVKITLKCLQYCKGDFLSWKLLQVNRLIADVFIVTFTFRATIIIRSNEKYVYSKKINAVHICSNQKDHDQGKGACLSSLFCCCYYSCNCNYCKSEAKILIY